MWGMWKTVYVRKEVGKHVDDKNSQKVEKDLQKIK